MFICRRVYFASLFFLSLIFVSFPAQAQESEVSTRGEYLTKNVAMCVQCHSPRNASGELESTKLFYGAPMPLLAPDFADEWGTRAPNLTGFLGYSDAEAVHFLQTGERRDGTHPKSPMPPYRMNKEDAEAIVQYLKSLS